MELYRCLSSPLIKRICQNTFYSIRSPPSTRFARPYLTKMDLVPSETVRGMTELDKSKFVKSITVPSVRVSNLFVGSSLKVFKKYLLKLSKLRPVLEVDSEFKCVLLDPLIFGGFSELGDEERAKLCSMEITSDCFSDTTFTLQYENFKLEDVLKAVLPEGKEGCTSYSRIGHIIHLNLKDHLLPYGRLIGQVMIDKLVGISTVVNKSHVIDSTYRNFQMDVLAGEPDFIAQVKENGCSFKFDFSQVYWNSRLCTEHERVVKLLPEGAVLFDVFAGVGPFAIPAARLRRCRVFANDLNPLSYQWLLENVKTNKVAARVEAFNLDGRQFIRQELKTFLLSSPKESVHVTMNLPALAVEFLDAFVGLLSVDSTTVDHAALDITVHVYSFCQESSALTEMRSKVEMSLQHSLKDEHILEIIDVRDVAPKKHMIRMSFRVPIGVLSATSTSTGDVPSGDQPGPKRAKLDSSQEP